VDAKRPPLERLVRRSGRVRSGCQPHPPTTPVWYHTGTTGVRSLSRASGITPCTTGLEKNHAQHTTTLPWAGLQHNGPAYHACTTGNPQNGRSYHALHHGRLHDGAGTTGLQEASFGSSIEKGMATTCPGRRTAWCSAAASAPQQASKMPTISRAKRSAATPCSALRYQSFGLPPASADHPIRGSHLPQPAFGWDHAPLGSRAAQRALI